MQRETTVLSIIKQFLVKRIFKEKEYKYTL